MKICVLGAGAWGTALAIHAAKKFDVTLWARNSGHISGMKKARSNPLYLGDFNFPDRLEVSDNFLEAVNNANYILSAIPTSGFRDILNELKMYDIQTPVIWANKGLEQNSSLLPYEIFKEVLPDRKYGVLSGPSFAAELVRELPTAVTLASEDESVLIEFPSFFHHNNMRIYTNRDVIGASVGGSLKNIIAIAAGISDGMGFGNNARAALITRGISEISRFGIALGAKLETFSGLAGIGDLFLTCTGDYSRNREVGLRLAKGNNLNQILESLGHVAEGVYATREVVSRAKTINVDMPITNEVAMVLDNKISAYDAVKNLLDRNLKSEH
jgi:glycerol-3-phosphate dehydrogenase (NAD(P)+)